MKLLQRIVHTRHIRSILLIRVLTGVVFLSEGIQKFLFTEKVGAGSFEKIGLSNPQRLGAFVGSIKINCALLLLIGLLTRLATIPVIIIMLTALASTKYPILMESGFWEMMHAIRTDWAMLLGSFFYYSMAEANGLLTTNGGSDE